LNREEGDSIDYTFEAVRCEIELSWKKIGQDFYYDGGDSKFTIVMTINKVPVISKYK
jgi:hypothetical protein